MDMGVETAYRRSIETVIAWIGSQVNMNKTHVFFRTFAPVHFRFALLLGIAKVSSLLDFYCI